MTVVDPINVGDKFGGTQRLSPRGAVYSIDARSGFKEDGSGVVAMPCRLSEYLSVQTGADPCPFLFVVISLLLMVCSEFRSG